MLFYAHKNNKHIETIKEHIDNCIKVYNMYNEKLNIECKIKSLLSNLDICKKQKDIHVKLSEIEIDFIYSCFINVIKYHDYGKINPAFQKSKMGQNIIIDSNMDTGHSKISTMIYINEMFQNINDNIKEKLFVKYMIILFSNEILNHHGNMKKVDKSNLIQSLNLIINKNYLKYYSNKMKLNENSFEAFDKVNRLFEIDYIEIYILMKIVRASLITADFIATYNFYNSNDINFEVCTKINEFRDKLSSDKVISGINKYTQNKNYFKENNLPLINELRSDIFIESTSEANKNKNKFNLFSLKAPTGAGKTYTSLGIVSELLDSTHNSIMYTFPINSVSNQSAELFKNIFDKNNNGCIQEINSITPFYLKYDENENVNYNKTLLDRQLFNYPVVLTSNITLFNLFFGTSRENALGFFKLFNSIIVLDEIQNYDNTIWYEMIQFLKEYSEILNIKIVIMSATLPDLGKLINSSSIICNLMKNAEDYYNNPLFKNRVKIDVSLINKKMDYKTLTDSIINSIKNREAKTNKKVKFVTEFIKKNTAKEFYQFLKKELNEKEYDIMELDSDDNYYSKQNIIGKCKDNNIQKNVILITTQVIECGVDIDMDLGAKDCSFIDLDEQFIGRINRSCLKEDCKVYLFNLDNEKGVYRNDYRSGSNAKNEYFRDILINKDFDKEYNYVINKILKDKESGLLPGKMEFLDLLKQLDYIEIEDYMKLIKSQTLQLFIPSILQMGDKEYNGYDLWKEYTNIINNEKNYSKRRTLLSQISKNLNIFSYNIYANEEDLDIEKVAGYYYLDKANRYIKDNKFDSVLFKTDYIDKCQEK